MNDQWLRKVNLTVFKDKKGLDLSDMHFRFNIEAADVESPNSAVIRIYNLSKETVAKMVGTKGEFTDVAKWFPLEIFDYFLKVRRDWY